MKERRNNIEQKEIQTSTRGRESHDRTPGRIGTDHGVKSEFPPKDATGTRTVQSHPLAAEGTEEMGEYKFRC